MKKQINFKQKGNSLLELLLVSTVIGTTVFFIGREINHKSELKVHKVVNEQFEEQSYLLTEYINKNRLDIVKKSLPYVETINNLPISKRVGTNFNPNFKNACLIVVNNNGLKSYMYLNQEAGYYSTKDMNNILAIGKSKNYEVIKNENSNSIIKNNASLIKQKCGITSIKPNSVLFNLNYNDVGIDSVKNLTTDGSKLADISANSVKVNDTNDSNKTITSNLYLDNVTRESYNYTTYYCDVVKFKNDYNAEITNLVNQYATNKGWRNNGNPTVSVVQNGNNCVATITGNFSKRDICNVNDAQNSAYNTCNNYHPNGYNYADSFTNTSNYLSGSTCVSTWNSRFQKSFDYDAWHTPVPSGCWVVRQTEYNYWCDSSYRRISNAYCPYWHDVGTDYQNNQVWGKCWSGDSYVLTGLNNDTMYCGLDRGSASPNWHVFYSIHIYGRYDCAQTYQCATINYTPSYGSGFNELVSNSFTKPAYQSANHMPRNHLYQPINLKKDGKTDIAIRTSNPNGLENNVALADVTLNIDNANIKAGYVLMKSSGISAEQACDGKNLGRMVQETDETTANTNNKSQLVCSYDPEFCPTQTGYCYIPLKSQSVLVASSNPVTELYCPAGTRVDTSYNFFDTEVSSKPLDTLACQGNFNLPSNSGKVTVDFIKTNSKFTGVRSYCTSLTNPSLKVVQGHLKNIKCTSAGGQNTYDNCKSNNGIVTCN